VGIALVLAAAAVVVWGTYQLIGTESCGTHTTQECSPETGLHILAVVVGPFVGGLGMLLLALRGGGTGGVLSRAGRREKRLADRIARGEAPMPTVARPGPMPEPIAPLIPVPEPAATPSQTPIERLQELAALRDKGLVTAAEFETQKKRILGGM
jgi:hypothetical protein